MSHKRVYPERPIVAVSAIIFNYSNEILIVKRAKEPGKGLWSIPGGAVKTGETLTEALRREIGEECKIKVIIKKFFNAYDRILYDQYGKVSYHYIILNYICSTKTNKVIPSSDVEGYSWIRSDELDDFDYTEGVKQILADRFNLL